MIKATERRKEIGEVYWIGSLLPTVPIPKQPVKVVRVATQEEFVAFWESKNPAELRQSMATCGPIDVSHFYEVVTD
jgi:hypothetical protein